MSKLTTEQLIAQHEAEIARLKKQAQENERASYPILGKMLLDESLKDDIKAMNTLASIEKLPKSEKNKLTGIVEKLKKVSPPIKTESPKTEVKKTENFENNQNFLTNH